MRNRTKKGQCANCPSKEVYCRGRCTACYVFLRNHGIERPWQELEPRRQNRQKKAKCLNPNCTETVTGHRRCKACKAYFFRNKIEKPLEEFRKVRYNYRKIAKPPHCRVCRKPEISAKGRCRNCARYWRVHQKPRPRHLWGIGPHGWCACGRPAYHLTDGIGKCAICKDKPRGPTGKP